MAKVTEGCVTFGDLGGNLLRLVRVRRSERPAVSKLYVNVQTTLIPGARLSPMLLADAGCQRLLGTQRGAGLG